MKTKHLIKDSSSKIHMLFENEWTDITESIVDVNNISQEEYELHGMDSLDNLPLDILNQEEEFEVLTWSDAHEIVEKANQGVEQVIDSGKMFETTIEDFTTIVNVEVL